MVRKQARRLAMKSCRNPFSGYVANSQPDLVHHLEYVVVVAADPERRPARSGELTPANVGID